MTFLFHNCPDVNNYENKLTELKERWLEIETRFTRNELPNQFVNILKNIKTRQ